VRIIQEAACQPAEPAGPLDPLQAMCESLFFDPTPDAFCYERDYVWGPDYVDELAFVILPNGNPRYALLDANYNVMALARPDSQLAAQQAFGPYGDVLAVDYRNANFPNEVPIGHQGLFFMRLDDTDTKVELEPGAVGLYYNRNRFLSPQLGRFIARDMNETAVPIVTALAFNAQAMDILVGTYNGQGLYADGMNLYEYLGSNPVNRRDPLGLYDDSWLDDYMDDYTGYKLSALGVINEGAKWAALGIQTTLDIAGSLLGIDVFQSVQVLASGRGGFWDAMNIVASVTPIGQLGRAGGILGKAFKWGRRGGKTGHLVGAAAEHLLKILPYRQAQKLTKGFKSKIQAHHILEVRHAKRMGLNTGDIPAVILPDKLHTKIGGALRNELPYLGDGHPYSKDQIWRAYKKVYKDYPEWLQAVERYLK